jgi:hypothetical protein
MLLFVFSNFILNFNLLRVVFLEKEIAVSGITFTRFNSVLIFAVNREGLVSVVQ